MAAQRRPMMTGNWKMFKTRTEANAFIETLSDLIKTLPKASLPEIVVAPPFTALDTVRHALDKIYQSTTQPILLASQTMEAKDNGAYTGEISPLMLKDLSVNPVIIGHSERRQYFNETNQSVNEKTKAALAHHITPIVCVGETLEQREANQTDTIIQTQVREALKDISPDQYEQLVLAYEPVWAIGTGKVCEADEANRVCALIRAVLNEKGSGAKTRILYGGSVKPDNIKGLMAQSDIDGGLVGGASLEPESFFQLIQGAMLIHA